MYTRKHIDFLLECIRPKSAVLVPPPQFSDSDWDEFLVLVMQHGVAALLYRDMKDRGLIKSCPGYLIEKLEIAYYNYAKFYIVVWRQFEQVCRSLKSNHVNFLALKGAHLSALVYGNEGLRPMSDLDILVKKEELSRARTALENLGYSQSQELPCHKNHHHLPPYVKKGSIPVEIHWTVQHPELPFEVDVDGIFDRAQYAEVAGMNILVLSPEDLLLHLSIHACQHNYSELQLKQIYDIRQVILHFGEQLNWEQVASRAQEWKITRPVFLMMRLANGLTGAMIPEHLLASIRPHDFDEHYLEMAKQQVFQLKEDISTNLEIFMSSRSRDKIKILLARVFSSTTPLNEMHVPSEPTLLSFYYRLIWLWRKYGQLSINIVRKRKEGVVLPNEIRARALRQWLNTEN